MSLDSLVIRKELGPNPRPCNNPERPNPLNSVEWTVGLRQVIVLTADFSVACTYVP